MAQTDSEKWLAGAEEYGAPLEDWQKVPIIADEEDIDETMSIPGVKYTADPTITNNAKPQNFVQLHLSTLFAKISSLTTAVETAISGLDTLKTETMAARDAANSIASQMSTLYDTINAWWPTFRQTAEDFYNNTMCTSWVNWYNGFKSDVESWQTDTIGAINTWWAAKRPEVDGWFTNVQSSYSTWLSGIQTNWSTFYQSAQSQMTDWATWVVAKQSEWTTWFTNGVMVAWESLRSAIQQATSDAASAAGLANTKAQYAETQGDRAKAYNDHPWQIGDDGYIYVWDEEEQSMTRTNKMIIDFEDLTEEQIEEMMSHVVIVTASIETCEAIVDELV